jgi:cystathionine beta-lyase/cystathionine gamma-synthase
VISFELSRERAVPAFLNALSTVLLAESLGGVETLVTHPSTMTHADIPLEEQAAVGLTPALVRLSVGIEDPDDLERDLAQALRRAQRTSQTSAAGR